MRVYNGVERVFGGGCVRGPEGEDKYGNIIKHNYDPDNTDVEICVLCCEIIHGYGHNPYPLSNHGKCCTNCSTKVLKSRLENNWGAGR